MSAWLEAAGYTAPAGAKRMALIAGTRHGPYEVIAPLGAVKVLRHLFLQDYVYKYVRNLSTLYLVEGIR